MNSAFNSTDRMFIHKKWHKQLFKHQLKSGSITLMPKPPGGIQLPAFIEYLAENKSDIVVSLLQFEEINEYGLSKQGVECSHHGIEYINFQVKDHHVPQFILPFNQLVEKLTDDIKKGKNIVIHCYAGIGRTGLLAASILIKLGMQVDFALISLSKTRGLRVPETMDQISWLHHNYEQLSICQGS